MDTCRSRSTTNSILTVSRCDIQAIGSQRSAQIINRGMSIHYRYRCDALAQTYRLRLVLNGQRHRVFHRDGNGPHLGRTTTCRICSSHSIGMDTCRSGFARDRILTVSSCDT